MPGAVGLYEQRARSVILVARSQLADPAWLLATLAHELAHELLLKGGHLTADAPDHELVTDLLPVFLGVGVFGANATVRSKAWHDGNLEWFQISKQGYLSSVVLGYALAVFAHARGEDRPAWAADLRPDARETLWAGLRYLGRTGDTLFGPDTAGPPPGPPTPADVADRLGDRSPTVRLDALWDVVEHGLPADGVLPAVERCLGDKDEGVREEAVRTLAAFGPAAAAAVPRLIQAAWYATPAIRVAAAEALRGVGGDPAEVVPALAKNLRDGNPDVVRAAAAALGRYGPAATGVEPELLAAVEAAAAVNDDHLPDLLAALRVVVPDPRGRLRAHYAGRDPDGLRLALGMLRDQGG